MRLARGRRWVVALLVAGAIAGCGGTGEHAGSTAASPTASRGITVVGRERLGARLEEWTLRTPALREPTRVRVLLPAGYGADPRRRYPVLYLLHGADSDYR